MFHHDATVLCTITAPTNTSEASTLLEAQTSLGLQH
jgi:hypothetical protein